MIDFSSKITPARMQRTTANLQMALENDRGRIINSAAIRRLQQKTQVFPLATYYNKVLTKIGYNSGTITAVNSALNAIATDENAPIFGCSAYLYFYGA